MRFLYAVLPACFSKIVFGSGAGPEPRIFDVSYKLQNAAMELITNFEPNLSSEILNHGCWCSKLDPNADQMSLGGSTVYGEVDRLCKSWGQARKCLRFVTEVCEFHPSDEVYR